MSEHNHNKKCECHEHEHKKINGKYNRLKSNCCESEGACESKDCCESNSGCESGCGCSHEHSDGKSAVITLAASAVLLAVSFIPQIDVFLFWIIALLSTLLASYPIIITALKNLIKFKFDENILLVISIAAAFAIGELREAAAIALFFRLGEELENYASNKSRKSIAAIAEIRPETANILCENSEIKTVNADEVEIGSCVIVMPHEIVPLDAIVVDGRSSLDASAITGESLPMEVEAGDEVLSGMVNGNTSITIKTTAKFENSAASRIIEMVESAVEHKGSSQKLITRLAKIYTPIVVIVGVLLAIVPSLITGNWQTWIYRGLVFLVASCPCALVLSVPLGFFAGMGAAAKRGILVKGGRYVESLKQARVAVFDKTGTLTTGEFTIKGVSAFNGFSEEEVKNFACAAERYSEHPLAKSIVLAFDGIKVNSIRNFEEIAGGGTCVTYESKQILCGGRKMMNSKGIDIKVANESPVLIAVDGVLAGCIEVEGKIKFDAKQTIDDLKKLGVSRTFMLTGDNIKEARDVASQCGIDEYYAELLPQEKLEKLLEIKGKYGKAIFVGDGINDAPVLAAADAGVAMGLGTQAAMQAADIVLTGASLHKLADARKLFMRTLAIVKFNIWFALVAKALVLILGAIGFAPMWAAVFADVGVMIITVINSSRLLKVKAF